MFNKRAVDDLKQLLENDFSDDIEKVILFGSQLKGNADDFSDYDILIIMKKPFDWKLKNKIYDRTWEIDYKYNILSDIKIISKNDLATIKGKQPFIMDAINNGLEL